MLLTCLVPTWHSMARAELVIEGNDAAFRQAVENCIGNLNRLSFFRSMIDGLRESTHKHIIRKSNKRNNSVVEDTDDALSRSSGGTGRGTGSTINWDPGFRGEVQPNLPGDPCASLLHELRHSSNADNGWQDLTSHPQAPGLNWEEVMACDSENIYRSVMGLGQRTEYASAPLPLSAIH